MRLTRVDIFGFKSFSDRTPLDLSPGLTAIVGPNGCGKSNVIDAVKWALGEQRASALRGNEMLDVVFKGNGARAARNFAEVSLHFDNSDGGLRSEFTEVVITRRLYRSGESEYLLNKQAVRLKDIRNLLMDTGLGTGAYSVMEQGRIDAVLSADAVERRRIFEEAAGISRYRASRRESENKLARTEQNLLRLGDVVDELEKRQRSLKIQAGRARSYLAARDRMRALRSLYYRHQWKELGEQLVLHDEQLVTVRVAEDEARAALLAARAEVDALQMQLTEVRGRVDEAAEAHRQAAGAVEASVEREASLRERLGDTEERTAQLAVRVEELAAAVSEREREVEEVDARLAALGAETSAFEGHVAQAREGVEQAQEALSVWEGSLAEHRRTALQRMSDLTASRSQLASATSRRAAVSASRDRLSTQMAELGQQLEEQNTIQGELFAGARDLDAALVVLGERLESAGAHRSATNDALVAFDIELVERREQLAASESRRDALEELVARHEGVSPGAVALLESGLPGIEGLLVDHFHAPRELAEAVEAALGASTQAVLVSDRAHGMAALQHLREVAGGRVMLVPREGLHPREGAADGDRLVDRLELDGHREVLEALLGHVRLVADREALSRCVPDGVTVWVTPEGDILDGQGMLRGGTSGGEGGLVSRRAERDALVVACAELRARVDELTARRNAQVAEVDAAESHFLELQKQHRRTEAERERTRDREQQVAARRVALERQIQARELELSQLVDELAELDAVHAAAEARVNELEARVQVDREQEERNQQRARELQSALEGRQQILSGVRIELSARRERQAAQENERRQAARGLDERRMQADQVRAELAELARRHEELLAELQRREAQRGELVAAAEERASELASVREEAEGKGRGLASAQDVVRRAEGGLEKAARAVQASELRAQETRIHRDELRAKVLEELEVDLAEVSDDAEIVLPLPVLLDEPAEGDQAEARVDDGEAPEAGAAVEGEVAAVEASAEQAEGPAPVDWDAVASEIETLRDKLARMGNVNLAAVDELHEVEERLQYLIGQRTDLLEAQKSLAETIARVNKESRERFTATFEEVREHFRAIFRKLFQGGRADLTIAEGEDVLEAGIEITAAPPGKDARSITLLSGGERTLTAVGLLFALFRARPSPVCLLDEVDAALDETNIDRFCNVLEDFLGQSQFLVVTHARRTMSYADTVLGVTMQEHGVSKVLAMTLEDYHARQAQGRQAQVASSPDDAAPAARLKRARVDASPVAPAEKTLEAN